MRLQEYPTVYEARLADPAKPRPASRIAHCRRSKARDIASTLSLQIFHRVGGLLCQYRKICLLSGTTIRFLAVLASASTTAAVQGRYSPPVTTPQHPLNWLHEQPANKRRPAIPESIVRSPG